MSAPRSTSTKTARTQASSAADFKKRASGHVLTLPSKLKIRCRRVELQTFILRGTGDVHNPLLQIVSEALEKGSKADIAKMVGVEGEGVDLEMVRDMYGMVDRVVCESSVEPRVNPTPDSGELDDDLLYVHELEEEDKMFIFQWAIGGTSDLATFREQARADLDAVAKVAGGEKATK